MKSPALRVPFALFAGTAVLLAQPPPITLHPPSVAGSEQAGTAIVSDAMSGGTTKLSLAVEAPLGTKLAIKADLLQTAHDLAAPLRKDVPIAEALVFEDRTWQEIEATLPVPEVEAQTSILVRFHVRRMDHDRWQPAGERRLVVYPRQEAGAWKKFFAAIEKDHRLRLAVFGRSPRLRPFLRKEDVGFHDAGPALPAALEKDLLYLGETTPDDAAGPSSPEPTGCVVLFVNEPGVLAGVYMTAGDTGVTTRVNLPLLDDLASNPRTRQTFTDILQQTLNRFRKTP